MNEQTKAMWGSYLRNLLGVVLALVTTTMANNGLASPFEFGVGEWLGVANGLWAAAVPTLIRFLNTKDSSFGFVGKAVADEVSKKLTEAAAKAPVKKPGTKKPVNKK